MVSSVGLVTRSQEEMEWSITPCAGNWLQRRGCAPGSGRLAVKAGNSTGWTLQREKGITHGFLYFFKIREAWTQLIADRKESLKKVWLKRAQQRKGGDPGREGRGPRTQREGLTSGRRSERCQLHCIKINGGGKESRHKLFLSGKLRGFHRGRGRATALVFWNVEANSSVEKC